MKKVALLAVFALAVAVSATPSAPSANAVLGVAEAAAHKDHKNILVIFHASWCSWCHRLDGFLTDPTIAPIMDSSYEIVHLDVMEHPDKKDLENSGGMDLLHQYGGDNQGIPFYVILSPKGKILAKSLGDNHQNIGYPGATAEIAHFMGMIKSTSKLSRAQQSTVQTFLVTHSPSA